MTIKSKESGKPAPKRAYTAIIKTSAGESSVIWHGTRSECLARFERVAAKMCGEVVKIKSKAAKTRLGM